MTRKKPYKRHLDGKRGANPNLRMKKLRIALGMSQAELVPHLGKHLRCSSLITVGRWERSVCQPPPAVYEIMERMLKEKSART